MSSADRRWKRVKLDVRVKLRRGEEAEDTATVVRSYELSEGGMSVYAPEQMEIGTLVVVCFTLPGGGEALRLHAMVRNQRGFRCGLEFVKVSDAERAELARYLGSLADSARA
jgi:c-di-GMP-binding flagellar brake protein YcgR